MIKIKEVAVITDVFATDNTYMYQFKVSFWGRLKFLFQGCKAIFEMPHYFPKTPPCFPKRKYL